MKICIYSGTFNPIHNAHVKVAQGILDALNLDKIILIPNNIPPHKSNENLLAPENRLQMLKLAFEGDKFDINDIEIKLGGKSYSLNTVKEIKKQYQITERINFIVGTDSFKSIKKWYKYEELVPLVNFVVVPREENSDIDKIAEKLNIKELSYQIVNLPFVDISSSKIRNYAKRNKNLEELIPKKAAQYIKKNELLKTFSFDEIKTLLEQVFKANMKHCIAVSDMAVELAEKFGANKEKAKLAGILHDCVKYIDPSEIQEILYNGNVEVFQQEIDAPRTLHAPVGAYVAQTYFNIKDKEILDAIRFHTIGRKNMTMLDKVVFLADKIEPITREAKFRAKIEPYLEKGIDEAIFEYFELLVEKLQKEDKKITPYTKGVIGYFQNRL